MARMRSISSIETEISKVESDLLKAQERGDSLSARLLELQKTKQEIEAKKVMDAFRKSGKSIQKLFNAYQNSNRSLDQILSFMASEEGNEW